MGETRVDLQHLLEDLRDAYTGSLEETILTEVVANALDSGATRIHLLSSPADATLTVVDDGRGMQRRELARYHDVAASTKARGEGIGFAGVGIKLGLLVSREVVTETRRGATHVATRWHLASRHRAPWKWIPPPGMTAARGTAVRLALTNQLSPLLDVGYLEETIRRHFEPLLDPAFDDLLRRQYPHGVTFEVDGQMLARTSVRDEAGHLDVRFLEQRLQSVVELHAVPGDLVLAPHHSSPEPLLGVGHEAQGQLLGEQAFYQPLRIREVLLAAPGPAIRLRLGEMERAREARRTIARATSGAPMLFQRFPHRPPVLRGRLHDDFLDVLLDQPVS